MPEAAALVPVGDAATRAAAGALIREYLQFIRDSAREHCALEFDIEAMVRSDMEDASKFFPPQGRIYVVRHADAYVGVGCLKRLGDGICEIQRMYLRPAAHALYRSAGFREIDPYADNSMRGYQPAETLETYRSSVVFMELAL